MNRDILKKMKLEKTKQEKANQKENKRCVKESKKIFKYYSQFNNFGNNFFGKFCYFGYPFQEFSYAYRDAELKRLKNELEILLNREVGKFDKEVKQ